ncbi:ATP-binding cassette domain-containing protein [Vagococcus fessus]|uniref:ABC transporter domain-containing protein n=1 Tax=Vagococcus fessus TaxID=120370 RepID=A0A430A7J7_9ENTE|nr:ATP-binding cassette domain-containing protein [Vagococcus fessus]RSU03047.1 hypothetical protein CBF31_04845 [Vagococcus fessus]
MMMVRKLSIQERKTGRTLIKELDLTINKGDKLAIIGEEGNGKSTLLQVVRGTEFVPEYVEVSGEVSSQASVIGYLEQQVNEEDSVRIMDLFQEVDWNETLLKTMKEFGIDNLYSEQLFKSLSGGEKVRYQLLAMLAVEPDLILLDEPTNDIDIEAIEWLERFVKEITIPVVYVSHDEVFIQKTATIILHIELAGRKDIPLHTIDKEGYESYRKRRQERIEKEEHQIKSQTRDMAEREAALRQVWQKAEHQHQNVNRADPRLQKKVANLKNQRTRLEKEKSNIKGFTAYEKESYFSFDYAAYVLTGKKLATIDVPVLQNEGKMLAKEIVLPIETGQKIVITGNNGCGKSTLLKEIYNQIPKSKVGYMPQNYQEVLPMNQSAVEYLVQTGEAEEKTAIYTMLGNINFTHEEMLVPMSELSGGQQAKVLLLSMIHSEAEVLVLDEPTRNLSPITNPQLYQELSQFKGTVISVSHDRKYIESLGGICYLLTEKGLEIKEQ